MKRADGNQIVQVNLRLDCALKKQIVAAAETSRRSVNAEIITRLEQSIRAGDLGNGVAA